MSARLKKSIREDLTDERIIEIDKIEKINESTLKGYFGIDFGTTSSAVVRVYKDADGVRQVITYGDDMGRPIPSAIAIDRKTGEVHSGREAKQKRLQLSRTCKYISSIKREIDQDWEENIGGKVWTPVTVAAEVFKTLKKAVYDQDGSSLDQAVVAIPIGFEAKKREKIRQAAKLAGVDVIAFVGEPTAAFYANYSQLRSSSIVAVFDWGGGTLDVSILNHQKGRIEEMATSGLSKAGDDIDNLLARKMHEKVARKKQKTSVGFDQMEEDRQDALISKCEDAKIKLGNQDIVNVSLNKYGTMGAFHETFDYSLFEAIIEPTINEAIACLDSAIKASDVGEANIDRILMIGGSSNLRPLCEKMKSRFGDKLLYPDLTMWNVGTGAAMLAENKGFYYSNQSIGIELSDHTIFEFLKKGDSVKDWQKSATFALTDDSKEAHLIVTGDKDLRDVKIIPVPTYGFLNEKVIIKAKIDDNLIFTLEAKSGYRSAKFASWWKYDKLKLNYQLPKE